MSFNFSLLYIILTCDCSEEVKRPNTYGPQIGHSWARDFLFARKTYITI